MVWRLLVLRGMVQPPKSWHWKRPGVWRREQLQGSSSCFFGLMCCFAVLTWVVSCQMWNDCPSKQCAFYIWWRLLVFVLLRIIIWPRPVHIYTNIDYIKRTRVAELFSSKSMNNACLAHIVRDITVNTSKDNKQGTGYITRASSTCAGHGTRLGNECVINLQSWLLC